MTVPSRWTFEFGRHDARVSCPSHPEATMDRFGSLARCPVCGEAIDLCLNVFGSKECVLSMGHGGTLHVSPSGSSWPMGEDASAFTPGDNLSSITLSPEAFDRLVALVDDPHAPSPALVELMKKRDGETS